MPYVCLSPLLRFQEHCQAALSVSLGDQSADRDKSIAISRAKGKAQVKAQEKAQEEEEEAQEEEAQEFL